MLISKIKINIEDLYISKPLEKETFFKVITEKNASVIHSIFLIANELKSLHYFLSLDEHPTYTVSAYISVQHGYCGKAKQQINIINCMRQKRNQRPMFTITYKIINKTDMKEVFSFRHNTTNKNEIYTLIDKFYRKTFTL